ncbi:MAG: stage II sporulation protein M [Candidatus Eremiobacteraeota bacterium]|nr:stage II sporulation protein M [Candidatus Eremiobacteraeota bacterium]
MLERIHARGVRALSGDEIVEFGKLYRRVSSDLAYATGHHFEQAIQHYLNRLTARAHAHVYSATSENGAQRLLSFFAEVFPREFRRSWKYVALCAALTVCSGLIAFSTVSMRPITAYALLPEPVIPARIQRSLHDSNFAFNPDQSAMMSAQIITNNIRVAIIAFAGGMTLGAVTLFVILFNGILIGVMGGLFTNAGFGYDFWATVAPHGVLELTAIQIAGSAGFLLAAGVLHPGRFRRRDALRENGRRAGVLILGVAAMLLVAGTIEGFFSPLKFDASVRIEVGVVTAAGLIAYFGFAGLHAKVSLAP